MLATNKSSFTNCLNDYYYNYNYYNTYIISTDNNDKPTPSSTTNIDNNCGNDNTIIVTNSFIYKADFIGIYQLQELNKSVILLQKLMPTINSPLNLFPHRKTFRRKELCQLINRQGVVKRSNNQNSTHLIHPLLVMAHLVDCSARAWLIQTTILITINFILYSYTLNRSLVDQQKLLIKLWWMKAKGHLC